MRNYTNLQEKISYLQGLNNSELVSRINSLPDFKWDDEGTELTRRTKAGLIKVKMINNKFKLITNE